MMLMWVLFFVLLFAGIAATVGAFRTLHVPVPELAPLPAVSARELERHLLNRKRQPTQRVPMRNRLRIRGVLRSLFAGCLLGAFAGGVIAVWMASIPPQRALVGSVETPAEPTLGEILVRR